MQAGEKSIYDLADERIRLEREAFEIEKSRLEAALVKARRDFAAVKSGHPFLVFVSVALLALFSFLAGVMAGESLNENRRQRQREARLREALAQLGDFSGTVSTNLPPRAAAGDGIDMRRNVSVVVLQ